MVVMIVAGLGAKGSCHQREDLTAVSDGGEYTTGVDDKLLISGVLSCNIIIDWYD